MDQLVNSVDQAEEEMDRLDDLKLEIDGREEKFSFVVEAGEKMVNEGHHATDEVSGAFLFELHQIAISLSNTTFCVEIPFVFKK